MKNYGFLVTFHMNLHTRRRSRGLQLTAPMAPQHCRKYSVKKKLRPSFADLIQSFVQINFLYENVIENNFAGKPI
jgi:hypothetical protein